MATVDSQVDSARAARAVIVLRARLLQPGAGSKYLWDSVRVVRVVKNESGASLPEEMLVAHYSWEPGLPQTDCTVYLERFAEEGEGGWKLLDGSAKSGVSHVDP